MPVYTLCWAPGMHVIHRPTCKQNTNTHNMKINMSLKKYQNMKLPQNGLLDKHSVNGTVVTLFLIHCGKLTDL